MFFLQNRGSFAFLTFHKGLFYGSKTPQQSLAVGKSFKVSRILSKFSSICSTTTPLGGGLAELCRDPNKKADRHVKVGNDKEMINPGQEKASLPLSAVIQSLPGQFCNRLSVR